MTPKFQCPNCNQFELGFTKYSFFSSFDHQGVQKSVEAPYNVIRCGAFDCTYTGKTEEFEVIT
jgi:hypothetical protein